MKTAGPYQQPYHCCYGIAMSGLGVIFRIMDLSMGYVHHLRDTEGLGESEACMQALEPVLGQII